MVLELILTTFLRDSLLKATVKELTSPWLIWQHS